MPKNSNLWFITVLASVVMVWRAAAQDPRTATALPTVVNGFLVAITVTDGGAGYLHPPVVTIAGGGGTGAAATATLAHEAVAQVIVTAAGSGYTNTPTVVIAAPPATNPPFSDGLVAYYPFTGNANDASPCNNHGTNRGAQPSADRFGAPDACYWFNGTRAYVEVPSSPSLRFETQLTVSAWIFPDYLPPSQAEGGMPIGIAVKGYDVEAPINWAFFINGEQERVAIANPAGWIFWDSSRVVRTGLWQQVAFTYDGQLMKTYGNGVETGRYPAYGPIAFSDGPMRIGAYAPQNGTISKLFFPGKLDDIRVYNRALSAREMEDLYYYEAPEEPSRLSVRVKTVQVTMHVRPAKTYQLRASLDLKTWSNLGKPFVAVSSELVQEFDTVEVGRYFQLSEVP